MAPEPNRLPRTPAFLAERERLEEGLRDHYDRLVEEYRYFAVVHHKHPFVSYKVLADLIRGGWRCR